MSHDSAFCLSVFGGRDDGKISVGPGPFDRRTYGVTRGDWLKLKCKALFDQAGHLGALRFLSEETYTHREFLCLGAGCHDGDANPYGADVQKTVIEPGACLGLVEAIDWLFHWCADNVPLVTELLGDAEENVLEGIYHAIVCEPPHFDVPYSEEGQGAQFLFCVLNTVRENLLHALRHGLKAEYSNEQPMSLNEWRALTGRADGSLYANPDHRPAALASRPVLSAPPHGLPIDVTGLLATATSGQRERIKMIRPWWAEGDGIDYLFSHEAQLIETGRVVWGAVIQANEKLFSPAYSYGGGGEVLYDPAGRMSFETLEKLASTLSGWKGKTGLRDEDSRFFADYLANERIRVFGRDVPKRLCRYPLKVSSTYFDQLHLPDGMLSLSHFPILISDECPGAVMVLPSQLWPKEFREEWLRACQRKHGRRYDVLQLQAEALARAQAAEEEAAQDPDPYNLDPVSLYLEGLSHFYGRGVPQDDAKARRFWEKAARLGHGESMNNLGIIHSEGRGVKADWQVAYDWYQRAAETGCVLGCLNLGKMHLRPDSPFHDRAKALYWLDQAAEKGNLEAEQLLMDYQLYDDPDSKAGFLGRIWKKWFH